ncbi:ecto-ADP-ribosyltransferase 5-like [Chanos chanos]|uniref:NAD(P)(+)--arginine ADP-ribosyltransferase n=1 Tax=Chanos chanos TaxID=29144 RepID=A0A6J2VUL4_CHACN|nr:ecto-ADP-ribosyltransferase 5-like [Chanos chanos]
MAIMLLFMLATTLAAVQNCKGSPTDGIPLDMAMESVDDAYFGCTEKMSDLVKNYYLKKEMYINETFRDLWKEAVKSVIPDDGLKKEHAAAIWVYTNNAIYADFNRAVGHGEKSYKNGTFQYQSLHFLLTTAIQILKKKQPRVLNTYRGTTENFSNVSVNATIRFGRFASSSWDVKANVNFGNRTCFEIETQFGANITKFSVFPSEKEVLIPPYEKFKTDWALFV